MTQQCHGQIAGYGGDGNQDGKDREDEWNIPSHCVH